MTVLDPRTYFKPFMYPFAFEGYKIQKQLEWSPEEVPLANDVRDWQQKLTAAERMLLTQIFRFFTTADVDIAAAYYEKYLPRFRHPELRMMMGKFASMEATHVHAYSLLLDTVGMPETEYQAFESYKEMRDKHEFMFSESNTGSDIMNLALDIAVFSAFGEGMQLFSSFAILQNFARFGKMQGMNTIITWSTRDEAVHVEYMIKLFHTLVSEYPELQQPVLEDKITSIAVQMVILEDHFIDLAFAAGEVEGLTTEEVKTHIRFIADHRMTQLGYTPIYNQTTTPLTWLDHVQSGTEHVNFFEQRATDYSKASLSGSWDDFGF